MWSTTTLSAGPGPTEFTASDDNQAVTNTRLATETDVLSTASESRELVETSTSMQPLFQGTPICGTATARGRMNGTYPGTGTIISNTSAYCGFNSTGTGGICLPTSGNSTYQWVLPSRTGVTPYVSKGTLKEIQTGLAWLVTALSLTYYEGF